MDKATNGTTEANKGPSKLEVLAEEHAKQFKGKTTPKRAAELVKAYQAAQVARGLADKKAAEAADAESKACEAIIRECSGKGGVTIGGVQLMPMSRGERVFFRRISSESIDLGG